MDRADTRRTLQLLLVVVCLLYVGVATSSDVCTACKCQREGFRYDIACNCDKDVPQDLEFTGEFMQFRDDPRLASTADMFTPLDITLSIADCRKVQFRDNLSLMATRVDVRNVTSLVIEGEGFVAVGDLEIRHVEALRLEQGAFFTHNLTSLIVEDSFVELVEVFALASVVGLRRLELTRVTVKELESHAVILNMMNLSHVLMSDTAILKINSDGLTLRADNLTIVNSSFGSVQNHGFEIIRPSYLHLTNNTFRNLEGPRSFCMDGSEVEVHVTANKFSSFPSCLLENNLLQKSLEFVDNEFQNQISNVTMDTLANNTDNYYGNSFQCECTDDFGRSLSAIHDAGYGPLLEKIFCISEHCPHSITHHQLLQQFQGNWSHCALEEKCVPRSSGLIVRPFPFITIATLWLLLHLTIFW